MKPARGTKVLVAMSGGVDSAVAAALLKDQGYNVVGCFMRLGSDDSISPADDEGSEPDHSAPHQGCCSLNDACDARSVAAILDVPFYVVNFKKDFARIKDYFVQEYHSGRTPNPCIRCNDWLKFGRLWDCARSIEADFVATGHYARIDHEDGGSRLRRGVDEQKDQSYVLFGTRRWMLRHMLLPIGRYRKDQIRRIAAEKSLPVFDKPDSQEICFVPDNDYARVVMEHSPGRVRPGPIVDRSGRVLGEHCGHQHFTIGQRRGLSLSLGHPIYVVDKNPMDNSVTVGTAAETEARGLIARETNWLRSPQHDRPMRCDVKIRSNGRPKPAVVYARASDHLEVRFESPQHAVAPGQAVACYDGDELIGGGWIDKALAD